MLSASVVQTISEACSSRLSHCPCNNRGRKPQKNWLWKGCDDNVHFGRRFTRKLFDPYQADWHRKTLMNLHNTGVGRRVVVKSMDTKCLCQGTSGSCTIKICHRKVASIEEIGKKLKLHYDEAKKVTKDNSYSLLLDLYKNKRRGNPNRKYKKGLIIFDKTKSKAILPKQHPHPSELVFLEDVPDQFFCEPNSRWHVQGTRNRICNSKSNSTDNCDHLCCNRSFVAYSKLITDTCHCKFIWCCKSCLPDLSKKSYRRNMPMILYLKAIMILSYFMNFYYCNLRQTPSQQYT